MKRCALVFTLHLFFLLTAGRKKQKHCQSPKLTLTLRFIKNFAPVFIFKNKMLDQKVTSRDFRLSYLQNLSELFILKENHISGGNQQCLQQQQQQDCLQHELCDEFKLTLPLEFADDGIQEGVLVRHMTSSDGHGSDRGSVGT